MTNRSFKEVLICLLVLCSFSALASAQTPTEIIDRGIKEELALAPCKNIERQAAVRSLFAKNGAAESDITVEKFKDIENVVVVKKGKTDETVVIGAHYDKVSAGCGVIDNWSGVVILARLYNAIRTKETQKTYMFVAFDKEQTGLEGSSAMAKAIPKEKRPGYCSMINFDSFGLGYPVVLENTSSSKMIKLAKDLGAELKVNVTAVPIDGADADSSSFKNKDIPAVTISGLSGKWAEYLHSPKDKLENTIVDSVRIALYFGLAYVAKVESSPCSAYR